MLSLIVAMTDDGVIGRNNTLPWRLPEDLKRFKDLTMGHAIIMGRKTFDSIGKPLPGRTNIVVSRNPALKIDGAVVTASLGEAVRQADADAFVIGGAELFRQAWPLADRLYLTLIHEKIEGDVFFPEIDWRRRFIENRRTSHVGEKADKLRYSFVDATKK